MLNEQDETRRNGKATSGPAFPRKTSFKREINAPDYDALKDLKACRREYEENEKGHDAKRYELLQRGARDARIIRRDDELWEKFADDPFWIKSYNGGKPRPQKLKRDKKSAVRYALIYMLRARTEEAKQLARKYARSVARHLENGVKIADLAATMSVPGNGIEDSSHANKKGTIDGGANKKHDKVSNHKAKRTLDVWVDDEKFERKCKAAKPVQWTLSSGKRMFRKVLGKLEISETIDVRLKRLNSDGHCDFHVTKILSETD